MAAYWLSQGQRLTVDQVAVKLQLSERGAYSLMARLAGVLPIERDGNRWQAAQTAQEARNRPQGENLPPKPAAHVLDRLQGKTSPR